MKLLVIGNGFDLAHNLPTRYTDFLRYCKEYNEKDPVSNSNEINQEFLDFIKNNIWFKYFIRLDKTDEENTWIDFEKEIAYIIDFLEENRINIQGTKIKCENIVYTIEIENNNNKIRDFINEFTTNEVVKIYGKVNTEVGKKHTEEKKKTLKAELVKNGIKNEMSIINFMYEELRNFARVFEIYCLFVNKKNIKDLTKINTGGCFRKIDYVLSFNYTNTYERLYGNEKIKYCYIHGKAQENKEKTNLIFGIDDNLKDGNENQKFEYVKFKKYYQRIVLKTGSEYKDWLADATNSYGKDSEVHIVGHSLDKTDYDVLYEIFENPNVKITVYYYNQSDLDEKVQRVIRLLSYKGKNGRDELIRRVHGSDWTIRFVDQYDKKDGLFLK